MSEFVPGTNADESPALDREVQDTPSGAVKPLKKLKRDIAFGVPIVGFTGVNGAGKTLLAVQSAIYAMSQGRTVYSTVQIDSPYGRSEPIVSLRQLLELRDVTVLLDEVAVIFSSRATAGLPADVVMLLQVLRHRKVTVLWTAPAWGRADLLLREVTQAIVNVSPLLRVHDGSVWPRPRFILAGLMDTSSGSVDETPTDVKRRRIYLPKTLEAFGAYDSESDTPMLGRHLAGGRCVDCGGSISTPPHSAQRHAELGIPFYEDQRTRPTH